MIWKSSMALLLLGASRRQRLWAFPARLMTTRLSLGNDNKELSKIIQPDTNVDLLSSKQANTVKRIHNLLRKRKKRMEFNQTVVEGPKMVSDLLNNPRTRDLVDTVVVQNDHATCWEQVTDALSTGSPTSCDLYLATPSVMNSISDTVTPQGIVAVVRIPSFSHPRSDKLSLILDGVSDPGNMGTLLRSSVAVGVSCVYLLPECCDVWNPKAVRSAMGCTFQIPIQQVHDMEEALQLRETSLWAATMQDSKHSELSVPYYHVDWVSKPSALVIGSEGSGLSSPIRQAIDGGRIRSVYVPMEKGVESLNAAVCGSVILFEYLRQVMTSKR